MTHSLLLLNDGGNLLLNTGADLLLNAEGIAHYPGGLSRTRIKNTKTVMIHQKMVAHLQYSFDVDIPLKHKIRRRIDTLTNLSSKLTKPISVEVPLKKKLIVEKYCDVPLISKQKKVIESDTKMSFNRIKKFLLLASEAIE